MSAKVGDKVRFIAIAGPFNGVVIRQSETNSLVEWDDHLYKNSWVETKFLLVRSRAKNT